MNEISVLMTRWQGYPTFAPARQGQYLVHDLVYLEVKRGFMVVSQAIKIENKTSNKSNTGCAKKKEN